MDKGFLDELNKVLGIKTVPLNEVLKNKKETKEEQKELKNTFLDEIIEEGNVDSLKLKDLLNYFVKVSKKAGFPFYSTNFRRDLRPFKLLKENGITNKQIIDMIDFIYLSPQNYLDKKAVTPFVLYSSWLQKLLSDSSDWREGKYKVKNTKKSNREWKGDKETDVSIGEW